MVRRQLSVLVELLACSSLLFGVSAAEPFVPDDRVISDPSVSLVDPEVDQVNNRIAWQTLEGELWVADLDPDTGDLTPANGKGELVDTNLASLLLTLNGPEWAYGPGGAYIIYTTRLPIGLNIAAARQNPAGDWIASSLRNSFLRFSPIGTPSSNKQEAKVAYYLYDLPNNNRYLAWRSITDPASEEVYLDNTAATGRWVEDLPLIVLTAIRDGKKQIISYDTETQTALQLTFDPSDKYLPYIWRAPETGKLLMMTMLDKTDIGIYQQVGNVWDLMYLIALPTSRPFVHSPEPFVYEGKSYILMVAADQLGSGGSFPGIPVGPTEIWIAGIDSAQPFFRRIDDPGYEANRLDPEIYFTSSDAVALYTEKNEVTRRFLLKRAITGLGVAP